MKLAFYYHIPVFKADTNALYLPGYLGVFIDALALEVEILVLIMHTSKNSDNADYQLKSKNIRLIDLGTKTPAWHRAIFHGKILQNSLAELESVQVLIVRSPSPLAPYFKRYLSDKTRLVYLIVGSYREGAKYMLVKGIRDRLVRLYLAYNTFLFNRQIRKADVIVNSPVLYDTYLGKTKSLALVKTTTLLKKDFFYREDTCLGQPVKLLYTGRIDPAKGLFELVEATADLILKEQQRVELHLVGWEEETTKPIELGLRKLAKNLGVESEIIFHGKKKLGTELNLMYRMADIYVIPSYHEGFPRTIWEAMANGLPVIATSVGAIPRYLKSGQNALLIEKKSANAIKNAILELINLKGYRMSLIKNGFELANLNTLDNQVKRLVAILENKKEHYI